MVQILAGQRLLVGALAAFTTVGYGALYYPQPLLAVAAEQAHGWTRVQTSLAFTLALLVTAMLAPRVGQVLDRHGGRWLLTAGALIGGLAFVLLASSTSYVLFIVGWLLTPFRAWNAVFIGLSAQKVSGHGER